MKNMDNQGLNVERLVTESLTSTLSGLRGEAIGTNMEASTGCVTPVRREGKRKVRFDHVEIHEHESYEKYHFIVSPTATTCGEEDMDVKT